MWLSYSLQNLYSDYHPKNRNSLNTLLGINFIFLKTTWQNKSFTPDSLPVEAENFYTSPVLEQPDNSETGFLSSSYQASSLLSPVSPPPSPSKPISPAQTTRDPNWQSTKSSVRERNAAMFNNSLMADVTFVVGPQVKI